MTLNKLIDIIDKAYSDDGVIKWYHREPENQHGDGLAQFIVVEVTDTYDRNATNAEQLDTARRSMESAIAQMQAVSDKLMSASLRCRKR